MNYSPYSCSCPFITKSHFICWCILSCDYNSTDCTINIITVYYFCLLYFHFSSVYLLIMCDSVIISIIFTFSSYQNITINKLVETIWYGTSFHLSINDKIICDHPKSKNIYQTSFFNF